MYLTNEPLIPNSPVKFKLTGFPEEVSVRTSLEKFYSAHSEADRNFVIENTYSEIIFIGMIDDHGRVDKLEAKERERNSYPGLKNKDQKRE